MPWNLSDDAFIWIFNVGRGSAAFIRTPLNHGMVLDISCSAEFSTSDFILDNLHTKLDNYEGHKIAQVVLTHPHHDHISDCGPLSENTKLYPTLITCPNDKDPEDAVDWARIKNRDGNKSLAKYKRLYDGRKLPLQTIKHTASRTTFNDLEYGLYYVRPSTCAALHKDDNQYGNSLSIVTYFRYGTQSILFPGDITPLAMEKVLNQSEGVEKRFTAFSRKAQLDHPTWTEQTSDQPSLKSRLSTYGLSVLLASHHGLESCYSLSFILRSKGVSQISWQFRRHTQWERIKEKLMRDTSQETDLKVSPSSSAAVIRSETPSPRSPITSLFVSVAADSLRSIVNVGSKTS